MDLRSGDKVETFARNECCEKIQIPINESPGIDWIEYRNIYRPITPLKKRRKPSFSFQREKFVRSESLSKIPNRKRIMSWKQLCSVCSGVQQVFRTGVNTSIKKYYLIFNRLYSFNARCSGIYPVLAIEPWNRFSNKEGWLHIPQKNPGYIIFNISVNTLTPICPA